MRRAIRAKGPAGAISRRQVKAKAPLCNCPATRERYAKSFPHRAGKVLGCHMGTDGAAKDGIARPGCHCRACNATNANNTLTGAALDRGTEQEQFSTGRDYRNWERQFDNQQAHSAGV